MHLLQHDTHVHHDIENHNAVTLFAYISLYCIAYYDEYRAKNEINHVYRIARPVRGPALNFYQGKTFFKGTRIPLMYGGQTVGKNKLQGVKCTLLPPPLMPQPCEAKNTTYPMSMRYVTRKQFLDFIYYYVAR